MVHLAQGKRSDTLGSPHSRVSAPCKGKSFNPLCCYSYLIADLSVLKWNIICIFCSTPAPYLKAFALTGRDYFNTCTQGVASLALGLVLLAFQAVPVQILVLNIKYFPYVVRYTLVVGVFALMPFECSHHAYGDGQYNDFVSGFKHHLVKH